MNSLTRPSKWSLRRRLLVAAIAVVIFDVDIGGRCGCDDPLPKVSSMESVR
jgi:hypothetical protein